MASLQRLALPGSLAPFGRRAESEPALTLMFVVMLAVLTLSFGSVAMRPTPEAHGGGRFARALGLGPAMHVREGFSPSAAPPAAEADVARGQADSRASPPPTSEGAEPGGELAGASVPPAPPSPTAAPEGLRVAHTDGLGVVLRTAPRDGARVPRGLLEGTPVTVLARQADGWALVRAPSGLEGWIPARYLAPTAP